MQGFVKNISESFTINSTEKPVDLSNLLYDEGTNYQKFHYFFFLSTSILSMGLELGKILTWGKNPIVSILKSFTFLKIFVFLLTKFFTNVLFVSFIVN